MKKNVLIVTGPTGSGKTELVLALAKMIPLSVINADSLQFFRHMDIGTAKPTKEERQICPHFLWDVLNPDEEANAFWYAKAGSKIVDEILEKGRVPCLVGGSGFYLRAFENPPEGPGSYTALIPDGEMEEAYKRILREDEGAARKIHPNDRYRVSRAISILNHGEKPSESWLKATQKSPRYSSLWVGLAMERKNLYHRIDLRTKMMFDLGLLEETAAVLETFPDSRFRLERTIGYREALDHLEGRKTRNEALEKAQQSTRNYAKRQMTWFRRESRMNWLGPEEALGKALQLVEPN